MPTSNVRYVGRRIHLWAFSHVRVWETLHNSFVSKTAGNDSFGEYGCCPHRLQRTLLRIQPYDIVISGKDIMLVGSMSRQPWNLTFRSVTCNSRFKVGRTTARNKERQHATEPLEGDRWWLAWSSARPTFTTASILSLYIAMCSLWMTASYWSAIRS